jgi:hypothetical protein
MTSRRPHPQAPIRRNDGQAMSIKLTAVTLMVLAVVVGGCGGGKKKSAGAANTATASTTTSAATTTTAAATPVAPTFASTKNCQQLMALGAKISQAFQASPGGGSNSIGNEANVFKALASAAPAEIRGDFETFAGAFSAYAQAVTKAGFKAGKTPNAAQIAALTAAAKSFSAPKLRAAEQHLSAWAKTNCGIGKTTTG